MKRPLGIFSTQKRITRFKIQPLQNPWWGLLTGAETLFLICHISYLRLQRGVGSNTRFGADVSLWGPKVAKLLLTAASRERRGQTLSLQTASLQAYNTYRYYIAHDEELKPLLANRKGT
ncbi:MAG: hypothetical protein IH820_04385 [Bacteroidetes bacterium]|nr:hypothetical protein [Bacteroidota bacterium]